MYGMMYGTDSSVNNYSQLQPGCRSPKQNEFPVCTGCVDLEIMASFGGILLRGPRWNTRVIAMNHSFPKKWVLCVFLAKSQTQWVGDSTLVPSPVCGACWQSLRAWPGPSSGNPQCDLMTQHNSRKAKSNWSKATYVYAQTKRPSSCSKTQDSIQKGAEMQRDMLFKGKVGKPVILKCLWSEIVWFFNFKLHLCLLALYFRNFIF